MNRLTAHRVFAAIALGALVAFGATASGTGSAAATEIKYIVNKVPITSYDIAKRVAFLKLQRSKDRSQKAAADQMIDQVLHLQEAARIGIKVGDPEVDASYQRFAQSNNLSVNQLNQILAQSGVTRDHFRDFIRAQMAWNQALGARARSEQSKSTQDAVRRMMKEGGPKPSADEYLLQQVIFVVPERERKSIMGRRKREANEMRARVTGCDMTRGLAKGVIDVTVRDLGRVLEPELPPEWKKQIIGTSPGNATTIRETERGVEFIAVCSKRQVSDDRVAQMLFQAEKGENAAAEELSNKWTAELRERAQIVQR